MMLITTLGVKWRKWHPNFSRAILGFWFRVPSMVENFHGAVLANFVFVLTFLFTLTLGHGVENGHVVVLALPSSESGPPSSDHLPKHNAKTEHIT